MFKKGDYVQGLATGIIVLVEECMNYDFNGTVIEVRGSKFKKGELVKGFKNAFFKKIDYKKHEESNNDDHVRDDYCSRYVPRIAAINPERFLFEYCLNFGKKPFGVDLPKDIEEEKVEEIKIVRKLEDLHLCTSENKKFKIFFDEDKEVAKIEYVDSMCVEFCEITSNDFMYFPVISSLLKELGFKFEHKPLRTEEEIMSDLVEKEFKFGEGNFLLIKLENGKWDYMNNISYRIPNKKYYTLESAKRVVKELNELLERKK